MKRDFLKLMKCPYCGSDFNVSRIFLEDNEEIINGSITCECNEYPILEGILIIRAGSLNKCLMEFISKGKIDEAIKLSMFNFNNQASSIEGFLRSNGIIGQKLGNFLSNLVQLKSKQIYKKISNNKLSFQSTLGAGEYGIYLKNRFSAESLWSLYPFISLLNENRDRILDLSCGMGHSSFIITNYIKPHQLVCADYFYSQLYLNKKYFAKDAAHICLDANCLLPFKDGIFSSLIMLDSFHYILERSSLAAEMERVVSLNGLLLLLHLHNSLNYNIASGWSLRPFSWLNLFQHLPAKIMPEKDIINNYILHDKLDLLQSYSEDYLNSCNALAIIGSRKKDNFNIYHNLWERILIDKRNLIINPIYATEPGINELFLKRTNPSNSFMKEYPLLDKYMPNECKIDGTIASALNGGHLDLLSCGEFSEQDLLRIEYLMKNFILIKAPPNYI